jgi:hypothetical protein
LLSSPDAVEKAFDHYHRGVAARCPYKLNNASDSLGPGGS